MGLFKSIGSLFSVGASVLKTTVTIGKHAATGIGSFFNSKFGKAVSFGGVALAGMTAITALGSNSKESLTTGTPAIASSTSESKGFLDLLGETIKNVTVGGATLLNGLAVKTTNAASEVSGVDINKMVTDAKADNEVSAEKPKVAADMAKTEQQAQATVETNTQQQQAEGPEM